MKDFTLLAWLTQLGLSVAVPLVGWIFLALWLQSRFDLGQWIVWTGVVLGLMGAAGGLRLSLKALSRLSKGKEAEIPPPVSFNDHD